MDMYYNKHYIKVDSSNRIVDGFSDAFREADEDSICINEQGSYQFRMFPDGEENPSLTDMDGIPLYQWDGLTVTRRSEEDIESDRAALPVPVATPTESERLAALEAAMLAIMAGGVVDV